MKYGSLQRESLYAYNDIMPACRACTELGTGTINKILRSATPRGKR